jgi:NADH-quinone oxidoreductase subunit J
MISPRVILALASGVAAVGLWWVLPGSGRVQRILGGLLAAVGFGLFASQTPVVGDWLAEGLLAAIATATVVAAVATISCRSPVYCAIWFGMTLTGTAGLFLLAGAEFLAVATLVVYAGAILVTFLFVLMLSQPEGHTTYDRRSWEALVSAFTGAVLVGILTATISASMTDVAKLPTPDQTVVGARRGAGGEGVMVAEPYSVARLGAELFTRNLVAVEAAGTLLFAALVGAAVIVSQGRAAMKGRGLPPLQPPSALQPASNGGTSHVS